ncbi:MAG: 50S ribosomal protein L25/general stress protein Ctc [Caulobacterales bacterium]|nr:50S ribosomal protein L25/general stress protein Ctc [Caulobacterales bacterium]
MSDLVLHVDVRERTGTGGARATRRDGAVPGVLYGGPLGPVPIQLRVNELTRSLKQGGLLSRLVHIDHDGDKQRALVREIQFHPVTSAPMHIDLFRVEADQRISVEVPVEFSGEEVSPGLKRGGALNIVRHTVELSCLADQIPERVKVDLSEADIGDSIHISAVDLPEGVEPTIKDRDFTIVTIAGAGGGAASEPEEGEDEVEEGESDE